jgi:uncharacterized protein HemX
MHLALCPHMEVLPMSDPYISPPGTNPPRHVRRESPTRWMLVAVAIALLLGVGLWEFNNRQERAASDETSARDETSTVGRSDRTPAPFPANPNGTLPQPGAR